MTLNSAPTRPPGLGGDDEVVVGPRFAGSGDDGIEGEGLIGPVDDQDGGGDIERIAGLLARSDLPVPGEEVVEVAELFAEFVRAGAGEFGVAEDEGLLLARGVGPQDGGLGVVEVGERDDRLGVLDEAVGQFVEGQADVLEADLLAGDEEGHGRKLLVHGPQ